MTKEQLRMQMLAGVITESEYQAVINKEIEEEDKSSLNESMIGGIVGIGAINQIPATPKTDYEMAFDHFLGSKYITEDATSDMEDKVEAEVSMNEEEVDYDALAATLGVDPREAERMYAAFQSMKNEGKEEVAMNEEDLQNSDVKSAIDGKKLDLKKLEDATKKAMSGDSTDLTMFLAGVFEGKEEISMNEAEGGNDSESSEITGVTNDYMKLIKTISDLIIKQKTADFPDKMKLHKQINVYGNQKVALEDKLIDTLAGLNQNAGLEGNNETIKSLLTQRSYNNEGKEVEEPNNY